MTAVFEEGFERRGSINAVRERLVDQQWGGTLIPRGFHRCQHVSEFALPRCRSAPRKIVNVSSGTDVIGGHHTIVPQLSFPAELPVGVGRPGAGSRSCIGACLRFRLCLRVFLRTSFSRPAVCACFLFVAPALPSSAYEAVTAVICPHVVLLANTWRAGEALAGCIRDGPVDLPPATHAHPTAGRRHGSWRSCKIFLSVEATLQPQPASSLFRCSPRVL